MNKEKINDCVLNNIPNVTGSVIFHPVLADTYS